VLMLGGGGTHLQAKTAVGEKSNSIARRLTFIRTHYVAEERVRQGFSSLDAEGRIKF
jgi:UDP-N-acetylglucosamine:LPS N-acetylglucosamine transferase